MQIHFPAHGQHKEKRQDCRALPKRRRHPLLKHPRKFRHHEALQREWEEHDLARYVAAICGQDTFAMRKPDPEMLRLTIDRAGGAATRAVMSTN